MRGVVPDALCRFFSLLLQWTRNQPEFSLFLQVRGQKLKEISLSTHPTVRKSQSQNGTSILSLKPFLFFQFFAYMWLTVRKKLYILLTSQQINHVVQPTKETKISLPPLPILFPCPTTSGIYFFHILPVILCVYSFFFSFQKWDHTNTVLHYVIEFL